MSRARHLVLLLCVSLIALVPVDLSGTAHAADEPGRTTAEVSERYKLPQGVTFNNPLGSKNDQWRVVTKILRAIRHARKGSTIRIMSWNFMSPAGTTALLKAQRRGVTVRLLMDKMNRTSIEDRAIVNHSFNRLHAGLKAGNRRVRQKERKSYARMCTNSCRGRGGQAHAKFFLFSHTGRHKNVLMQGSANLTTAASINQWNDLYTVIGDQILYDFATQIFEEMWRDKPVASPYAEATSANGTLIFTPLQGAGAVDPYLRLLNRVSCNNAALPGGTTVIRVAPDVIRNPRGLAFSRRLKELWNQGCDVRVGYTVLGRDSFRVLTSKTGRGPVPIRHLVQDFNGDKEFDNYFHLKVLTVRGNIDGNPDAAVAINGSSNISSMSSASDENIMLIPNAAIAKRYERFIDRWFNKPPPRREVTARAGRG